MSLRNIPIPKREVTLADDVSFTVYGLSPNHALGLFQRHRVELAMLFEQIIGNGGVTDETVAQATGLLLNSAPLLMAEIIALAAGGSPLDLAEIEPGVTGWQADLLKASQLPAPVQLDALQKIGDLTFTTEMPPKKFLGALTVMMAKGAQMQNPLASPSSFGD